MQLVTQKLFLRDHFNEDWLSIHEYVRRTIEREQREPRYKFDFAVVDRASGKVIGGAGIRRDSESSSVANMGYAINPLFQKKGLATEAAIRLLVIRF